MRPSPRACRQAGRQSPAQGAAASTTAATTLSTSAAAGLCRHAASTAHSTQRVCSRGAGCWPRTHRAQVAARVLVSPAHADVLGLAECPADIHLAVGGRNHLHLGHLCRTGAGAGSIDRHVGKEQGHAGGSGVTQAARRLCPAESRLKSSGVCAQHCQLRNGMRLGSSCAVHAGHRQ